MLDVEPLILDELERLAPETDDSAANWEDVLGRAGRPSRRPRGMAAAAVILLAGGAIPALAFSSGLRALLGFPPTHPVLEKAQLLASAPLGNGFYAHSWRSPSSTGGECAFLSTDHAETPARAADNGGGACVLPPGTHMVRPSAQLPIIVNFSIVRRLKAGSAAQWVPPIVSGSVNPALHAVRVEVRWRGGRRRLTLRGSNFIGGGRYLYQPPFAKFPFFVVAYDARGHEVVRKKLDSPSLRLMSRGWKQYAREYHAWQGTLPRR